jgi:cytochrome c553
MCHQKGSRAERDPRVGGQNYPYIVAQLKAFKERTRTNDAGNMTSVARTLTDADIGEPGALLTGLR